MQKLNVKRTVFIGLAFLSISAFWQFYDQVIPYLLEFSFGDTLEGMFGAGSKTAVTNVIMSFDNILALFLLPFFGSLSDRTNTRFGKRTPYIVIGTLLAVFFLVTMGFAEQANNFPIFFVALFLLLLSMSTYRSPAVALMPDLTPASLRSRANAIINLMGTVGGGVSLVLVMVLVKKEKLPDGTSAPASDTVYLPVMLALAAFMLLAIAIFLLTVKEKKTAALLKQEKAEDEAPLPKTAHLAVSQKESRRSLLFILLSVFLWFMAYNGVTTAISRYCEDVFHIGVSESSGFTLVALVAAAIAFIPVGALSARIGRRPVIFIGIGLMLTGFIAATFMGEALFHSAKILFYIVFAMVGIGWASINVNSFPMAVQISSEEDVGKYTGYYYAFSMAAQVATPIVSGFLISFCGYRILFPYAAIFMALAAVTMCFVKHGDVKAEKRSVLESFDTAD
ncbi:MAG: MFS transporter [Clostridia bacterium]|nr:MFS transporter [Clostridia bacterium]